MKNWIIILLSFIAVVVVNFVSERIPLNGQTMSEVSNKIEVLVTPAGYVFSIWGLIYLLLAVWVFFQWKYTREGNPPSNKLTYLFALSSILNIGWVFSFHYEQFILSTIIMLALLATLIALYLLYPVGEMTFGGRIPFSIYLGWISVATIANISYTLKYHDVSLGIGEVPGTIILIVVAAIIAMLGRVRSNDLLFPLVFVWAIIGIGVKNDADNLVTAAYVIAIVIFVFTVFYTFFRRKQHTA